MVAECNLVLLIGWGWVSFSPLCTAAYKFTCKLTVDAANFALSKRLPNLYTNDSDYTLKCCDLRHVTWSAISSREWSNRSRQNMSINTSSCNVEYTAWEKRNQTQSTLWLIIIVLQYRTTTCLSTYVTCLYSILRHLIIPSSITVSLTTFYQISLLQSTRCWGEYLDPRARKWWEAGEDFIICTLHQILLKWSNEDEMGGEGRRHGGDEKLTPNIGRMTWNEETTRKT
jgi:hypothetical protein